MNRTSLLHDRDALRAKHEDAKTRRDTKELNLEGQDGYPPKSGAQNGRGGRDVCTDQRDYLLKGPPASAHSRGAFT